MLSDFETKDSGKREKFPTGAQRDVRVGKGRYDLLPFFTLERDAKLMERGAEKYEARNWEQGFKFSRCLDSAIRHLVQYAQGDRSEDHLAASRFNIACIMHFEEMIRRGLMDPKLNDLPTYRGLRDALAEAAELKQGFKIERTFLPPRAKYNRAKCRLCSAVIESKSIHDIQFCDCGEIFVDGGTSYQRWGAKDSGNFIRLDDEGQEVLSEAGD